MFDLDLELFPEGQDDAVHRLRDRIATRAGDDDVCTSARTSSCSAAGSARTRSRDPRRRQLPLGLVYGQLTQGWRNFRGASRSRSLRAPAAATTPIRSSARRSPPARITRNDNTHVNTPFTNFYITGEVTETPPPDRQLLPLLRRRRTATRRESATGSFASFAISRFFNGLSETASSQREEQNLARRRARAKSRSAEASTSSPDFRRSTASSTASR